MRLTIITATATHFRTKLARSNFDRVFRGRKSPQVFFGLTRKRGETNEKLTRYFSEWNRHGCTEGNNMLVGFVVLASDLRISAAEIRSPSSFSGKPRLRTAERVPIFRR